MFPVSPNPLLAWMRLAAMTGEMLAASAEVIAQRTSRLAAAGARPGARDRRESVRMVQEKLDAAVESAVAMSLQINAIQMRAAMQAFASMLKAAPAPFGVRGPFQQHAQIMRALIAPALAASEVSTAAARVASRGVAPIRRRAVANAKRLRGR